MKRLRDDFALTLTELLASISKDQELFRQYIIGLYRDSSRGTPEIVGTALIVEHEEIPFAVSAKHVLSTFAQGETLYFFKSPSKPVPLEGTIRWNSSNDPVDSIDIGVIRLEGGALPPYPEIGVRPFPSVMLRPAEAVRDKNLYLFIGFPATQSRANKQSMEVKTKPFANLGPAKSAAWCAKRGIDILTLTPSGYPI